LLVIDRLAQAAAQVPRTPLLPGFPLSTAVAWTQSGGVASWLIAQGFGPAGLSLAASAPDSPERTLLLLGALRAGALVVEARAAPRPALHGRGGGSRAPTGHLLGRPAPPPRPPLRGRSPPATRAPMRGPEGPGNSAGPGAFCRRGRGCFPPNPEPPAAPAYS